MCGNREWDFQERRRKGGESWRNLSLYVDGRYRRKTVGCWCRFDAGQFYLVGIGWWMCSVGATAAVCVWVYSARAWEMGGLFLCLPVRALCKHINRPYSSIFSSYFINLMPAQAKPNEHHRLL